MNDIGYFIITQHWIPLPLCMLDTNITVVYLFEFIFPLFVCDIVFIYFFFFRAKKDGEVQPQLYQLATKPSNTESKFSFSIC